jgi:hypothetical protein
LYGPSSGARLVSPQPRKRLLLQDNHKEPPGGIEPPTHGLRNRCSTAELQGQDNEFAASADVLDAGYSTETGEDQFGETPAPDLLTWRKAVLLWPATTLVFGKVAASPACRRTGGGGCRSGPFLASNTPCRLAQRRRIKQGQRSYGIGRLPASWSTLKRNASWPG